MTLDWKDPKVHDPAFNPWAAACSHWVMHNWPLSSSSIVFVAGAYQGTMVKFIYEKYDATIYGFDPQKPMLDAIRAYGMPENKVKLFNFALGPQDATNLSMVKVGSEYCSLLFDPLSQGPEVTDNYASMVEIGSFMDSQGIAEVDLFHMNCEGYELILLPYLVETGLIQRFKNFMVQFHCGWNESEKPYEFSCDEVIEMVSGAGFYLNCNAFPAWLSWNRGPSSAYSGMTGSGAT